jgi:hypothetical protein
VIEARLRRYDREYRWFLFRAEPVRDNHGDIKRIYVSGGKGRVTVISQTSADIYNVAGQVTTAPGARTSFFVPCPKQGCFTWRYLIEARRRRNFASSPSYLKDEAISRLRRCRGKP